MTTAQLFGVVRWPQGWRDLHDQVVPWVPGVYLHRSLNFRYWIPIGKNADCRGNQRATARKYGIHRRQIQKWLQVEASLRTAVEVAAVPELPALNLARQRDDRVEATCQAAEPQKGVRVSLFPSVRVEEEGDISDDDEPLDFTCATLSKRRSFSLQFKLEVLDAFHCDKACHGNQRATARKFGINRRQVQKWLGQEEELRGEAAYRGGLYRQRLGRWPESEENKQSDIDQCWDLSNKKRKSEPILEVPQYKKPCRVEEVTSSDVQETALCLVKVERRDRDKYPEVSSSVDKLPSTPSPPSFLLPPHSLPMGAFVPPPSLHLNMVNLYQGLVGECKIYRHSFDCYHDDCQHYHPRSMYT
ncbi:hypothetical protein L9F63_012093 [Diploptera punctata]|uniref:Brinker DNA-binding domain-containing protein n=1 Tax=Diploptera punctata TaxID=6984 RepID=A0AAD8AEE6_DIPPU|nr:hypothetical protein L9F63_012093 [Diploptera punctata]